MAIIKCPDCEADISDRVHSCPHCQRFIGGGMAPAKVEEERDTAMSMIIPMGLSGWAVVAGYLGLFSLIMLPAPLALITGILAINDIKKNPRKHGLGRAWFGIIMGTLGSLALVLMAIFAAAGN